MPQDDENKKAVESVKGIVDDLKKANENLVKNQTETLKKLEDTMGILINATNRLNTHMHDVSKNLADTQKGMILFSQRLQGGLTTVPFRTGAKGRGLELKLKPEEMKALSGSKLGRLLAGWLTAFKKTYLFFPALGYAGVREMSRVARSVENLAMMKTAGGEEGGKKGIFGRLIGGRIGGAILGIFITVQSMFAIIKVIGFLFGDAVKPLESIFKLFKMAITFLLKPIADMLFIVLLPLAIFFTVLFAEFYKWFARQGFRALIRMMIGVVRGAISLAKGIAGAVGGILNGIKWLGGLIVSFYKFVGGIFKTFFGAIYTGLMSIYRFWMGVFRVFYNVLMNYIVKPFLIFYNFIFSILKAIWNFLQPILSMIWEFIGNVFRSFISGIMTFVGWIRIFIDMWLKGVLLVVKDVLSGIRWIVSEVWNIINLIWSAIKSFINTISWIINKIGNILGFQSGGYIQKTGIYKLHAGEMVMPKGEVGKAGVTNNYSININVTASEGMNIDDLVNEIERRIRGVVSW